jgi:chemotaxis protein MotB
LRTALAPELRSDKLEVVTEGNATVVRFGSGNASFFAPASERPSAEMRPILQRIAQVLQENPGRIVVQGHTDDVALQTDRFRSNWDLSTARASAVVTELMTFAKIDPQRIVVQGYADTRPLVPNDSQTNRAVNRRVEIHVVADDGSTTMIQLR